MRPASRNVRHPMESRTHRVLRGLGCHLLVTILSTLVIVLPIPRGSQRAHAQSALIGQNDGFTFSDQSEMNAEQAAASDSGNALKVRTSPIGSSGSYTREIAIRVPPGRSGMTPSLALTYSSASARKTSSLGAGWSFGVPSISRSTEKGFPRVDRGPSLTRYSNSGLFTGPSGRMAPISLNQGLPNATTFYSPTHQTSPVRYEFLTATDRWVEHLPNGVKRFYGGSDGRIARVVNELGTHEWLLLKERDPDGNTIEYDYHFVEDVVHGQLRGNFVKGRWHAAQWQPILKGVRWGANDVARTAHQFRVETHVTPFDGDIDMLNGHVMLAGLIDKISVFGPPVNGGAGEVAYWYYTMFREESKETGRPLLRTVVESAPDLQTPRTTTFTYSTNGDIYGVKSGTAACDATANASFARHEPLARPHNEMYRTGQAAASNATFLTPLERLSRANMASGYQFRDMDADGDTDVAYLPAGLSAPVAQWLKDRSYVRDGADWVRADQGGGNGIPNNLLITEFGDVDGDVDPDAISFPLYSIPPEAVTNVTRTTREQPYHYTSEFITINTLRSNIGYVGVGLPGIRLSDGALVRAPANAQVQMIPLNAPPACAPTRAGTGGGSFLSDYSFPGLEEQFPPLQQPWLDERAFDIDWQGKPNPLDPRDGLSIWPWIPWYIMWDKPWPWHTSTRPPISIICVGPATDSNSFGRSGHRPAQILIGRNSARGAGGVRPAMIDRWPDGVVKWVEPFLQPIAPGSNQSEMFFKTQKDFQAPATDLNADGKSDILLLKLRDQFLSNGGTKTSFIPRAYISDGSNFYLDYQPTELVFGIDLTPFFTLDTTQIRTLQTFRNQVRPHLAGVLPGTRVLPGAWTAPLRPATRGAVTALLASYSEADVNNPIRTAAMGAALTKLFEDDLWTRVPRPVVQLPKLFERWNNQLWARAWDQPQGLAALVPVSLVPNVEVDLSDIIVPLEGPTVVDLGAVLNAVRRSDFVVGGLAASTDFSALIDFFSTSIADVIGNVFNPGAGGPPSQQYSSFSWSALDILRDGREEDCNDSFVFRKCKAHHAYPQHVAFNSLPLDLNADGLPDLVVGARPIPVESATVPGHQTTLCARGHQVHLNRGYRWDTFDEWASHATAFEGWSSPPATTYFSTNKLDSTIFPFEILQNRSGSCNPNIAVDYDMVDLAMINAGVDAQEDIPGKLLARLAEAQFSSKPEWDRTGAAANMLKTSTLPMAAASFSDLNADGRVDLVFAAQVTRNQERENHQLLFLNTGRGFRNVSGVEGSANRSCVLPRDFVMAQFDSTTRTTVSIGDRSRLADVDNDGLLDLVYAGACPQQSLTHNSRTEKACVAATWRRNLRKIPDLLTAVEESTGAWEDVGYVAASSAAAQGSTVKRPGTLPQGHLVVSQILRGAQPNKTAWKDLFANSVERVDLSYDNYARETESTHSLGFETVSARFYNSESCARSSHLVSDCTWKDGVESTSVYDVRATVAGSEVTHPLRGMVTSQSTRDMTTGNESATSTTYVVSKLATGVARIRPEQRRQSTRVGAVTMYSGELFLDLDDYGYPRRIIAGRANDKVVLEAHPETTVTRLEYDHRPSEWRLGRSKSTTIEGVGIGVDGKSARAVLSQSAVAYNLQGRVASTSVLQDAGSACTANRAQWSTTSFPVYNTAGLPERIVENARTVEVRYDLAKLYVAQRWIMVPKSASSPGARLEEELAYDPRNGAVRWHRDINDGESSTSYDASGRVLRRTGPDGSLLERNAYTDTADGPWSVTTERYTDPGAFASSMAFLDGYGRAILNNEVAPAAGSTSSVVRTVYDRVDGYGRVTASYQPRPVPLLASRGLDPTDRATLRTFDGFDRETSESLPDGRRITHTYSYRTGTSDPYLMVQTTNPRRFVTQRLYDSRGALTRVERLAAAGSNPIEAFDYTRDGLGRIAGVYDATGVRSVAYDVGGRLVAATLAHGASDAIRAHEYCFDADGQLTSALTPEGREVVVQRDTLSRPQRVQVDFLHVENGREVLEPTVGTFMYDCSVDEGSLGKLCERSDDSGTTHYTYDAYGRQDSYELELSDSIGITLPAGTPNWYRGAFTFGLAGQLKSAAYEGLGTGVHRVDYTHDVAGRTSTVAVDDPRTAPRMLVKNAGYDELGRVVSTTLGNNVLSSWAFDKPSGHLVAAKLQQLTSVFAELRYPLANYDANGNIGVEERWYNQRRTSRKSHAYDALDRLTASSVTMDGFVRANETFSFLGGNVTQAGAVAGPTRYDYLDRSNTQAVTRIASPGFERVLEYDADGWVSRDTQVDSREAGTTPQVTERELTFDAGGCLREVTSRKGPDGTTPMPTVTRNMCGLSGARAYRETTLPNGNVERVYYLPNGVEVRPDQDLFIMRLPVATATVAHLAWSLSSGGIVASESGYVHTDVRGSVISRTPLDASNVRALDREAEYDAWGKTLAYDTAVVPRYQFTGEEPDPGTGYYFFGARAYDPTLRRWLSPDPLILGTPEIDAPIGSQLNLYSYAANNPVSKVDPSGTWAIALVFVPEAIDLAIVAVAAVTAYVGVAAYEKQTSNAGPNAPPPAAPSGEPSPSGSPKTPSGGEAGPAVLAKLSEAAQNQNQGSSSAPPVAAAAGGGGGGDDGGNDNGGGPRSPKQFTSEQKDLVDMAKQDKKAGGITARDMEAYKQLNAEAGKKGFTDPNAVRGPEAHPPRTPQSPPGPGQKPHGHVGPVGHIPVKP